MQTFFFFPDLFPPQTATSSSGSSGSSCNQRRRLITFAHTLGEFSQLQPRHFQWKVFSRSNVRRLRWPCYASYANPAFRKDELFLEGLFFSLLRSAGGLQIVNIFLLLFLIMTKNSKLVVKIHCGLLRSESGGGCCAFSF